MRYDGYEFATIFPRSSHVRSRRTFLSYHTYDCMISHHSIVRQPQSNYNQLRCSVISDSTYTNIFTEDLIIDTAWA